MKAAAVALALGALAAGCGGSGGELEVTHSTLRPGQIAIVVHNGSEERARIAQLIVNDAFVDFHAGRSTLSPGDAETIVIHYPWIRGEAYEIRLMASNGHTTDYEIEQAA